MTITMFFLGPPLADIDIDDLRTIVGEDDRLGPWTYVAALGVLVAAVVVGQIVRRVARRATSRGRPNNFLGDLIGRLANYTLLLFGFIYAMDLAGIAIGPILGALGIAGIAVAFAFQNILENFVAGIILQVQRPFDSGDEIVSADHEGTVTAIDSRTITMISPDGETIRIPNAEVLRNPIINHSQFGRRRTTLMVGVDYDSDLDRAVEVASSALQAVDDVLDEPPPEVLIGEFASSSIDVVVRFWHEPSIDDEWSTRDLAARALTKAFAEADISIPFPQRVLHYRPDSGR